MALLAAGAAMAHAAPPSAEPLPGEPGPLAPEALLGEPILSPLRPGGQPVFVPRLAEPPPPPAPFRLRLAPAGASESILPPPRLPAAETVATATRIKAAKFCFKGNHVFPDRVLAAAIKKLELSQEITPEELEAARQAVTLVYVEAGYINSGALIEEQPLDRGTITMTIVEGRLSEVGVRGNRWYRAWWLRHEAHRMAGRVLNEKRLKEGLQLLRQNQNISQVNAELQPGGRPGEALLDLTVQERQPFRFSMQFDNARPPSVGAYGLTAELDDLNLTGHGDPLQLSWGLLRGDGSHYEFSGADNLNGSYRFTVSPWGTTLEVRAGRNDSTILEEAFQQLDITSQTTEYSATLHQPLHDSLRWSASVSLGFERKMNESALLQRAFSLSPGAIDGRTEVDVLRAGLDLALRSTEDVLSFHTSFNWGLDVFDATTQETATAAGATRAIPDARFFSWLGQAQYVRRLNQSGLLGVLRLNAQLADNPLLSLEQFAIGGVNSVRGYRENTLLRDNAVFAAAELRIPLWQCDDEEKEPRGAFQKWLCHLSAQPGSQAERHTVLALVPFFDIGTGWRHVSAHELDRGRDRDTLTSAGLGLLFDPAPQVHAQLYWGYAFNREFVIRTDRNLQDYGIHFAIMVNFL